MEFSEMVKAVEFSETVDNKTEMRVWMGFWGNIVKCFLGEVL